MQALSPDIKFSSSTSHKIFTTIRAHSTSTFWPQLAKNFNSKRSKLLQDMEEQAFEMTELDDK
jgi:hypothetical protein